MFETTTYQVIFLAVIFLSPNVANEGLGWDSLMVHNNGKRWLLLGRGITLASYNFDGFDQVTLLVVFLGSIIQFLEKQKNDGDFGRGRIPDRGHEYLGISKNEGTPKSSMSIGFSTIKYSQIIHLNRIFHYKPSIFRYPYFWRATHMFCFNQNPSG